MSKICQSKIRHSTSQLYQGFQNVRLLSGNEKSRKINDLQDFSD